MIDITALIPTVIKRLKALETGGSVELRPYKRNRSVLILKGGEDDYRVLEDGFHKDEFAAAAALG